MSWCCSLLVLRGIPKSSEDLRHPGPRDAKIACQFGSRVDDLTIEKTLVEPCQGKRISVNTDP